MRIAVAQTPGAELADWSRTWSLIGELLHEAAGRGAELVVFPEGAWPAYELGSRAAWHAARAAGMPASAEFVAWLRATARQERVAVCAGYVEETHAGLRNAATLIDATGVERGVHRKCFLWDFDNELYDAGTGPTCVDTPWGRTGLLICADARLPEIPATLAARGARLMLQPTAWVNAGTPAEPWNPQPAFLIPARAQEFGVPFASASKWGPEGRGSFVGRSLICAADGRVVAQCGPAETGVITADVELGGGSCPRLSCELRAAVLRRDAKRPARDVPPVIVRLHPAGGGADTSADTSANVRLNVWPPRSRRQGADAGEARVLNVTEPTPGVVEVGGVGVAGVPADALRSFAELRALTWNGLHVAVVFGADVAERLVAARACENRVLIVWLRDDGAWCYDERGRAAHRAAWPIANASVVELTLDPRGAAEKTFAPGTDLVTGRRPEQYEL